MYPIPSLFITLPVAGFLGVRSSASSDFIATCGCLPNKPGFWLIPPKAQEARPLAEGQLPVAVSLEQRTGASWKRDERAQWDGARRGHAILQTPGEGQYFIRLGSHIQLQLVFRAKMGMSRYHQSLVRSGSCCLEVSTQTANKHPKNCMWQKKSPSPLISYHRCSGWHLLGAFCNCLPPAHRDGHHLGQWIPWV